MIKEIKVWDIQNYFVKRETNVNKGSFGKVGIIGGCENYLGALKLSYSSLAAMRSGCGLTRIILPENLKNLLAPQILEQTLYFYHNVDEIKSAILDLNSLAIGMGWGKDPQHFLIVKEILENYHGNIVIDADGLNILVDHLELISNKKVVLTPHLKEFSRLTHLSVEQIEQNKVNIVKEFAKKYHIILLLKGPETLISDGEEVYVVKRGCPGMATAGSGDVLSGILVGLLGYFDYQLLTVAVGAYLAGLAGEIAEQEKTDIAMLASDTISHIPDAIKWIREQKNSK